MPEIKFETGLVTYDLNGQCQVCFNPTDSAFAERLCTAFETLDKKQEEYQSKTEKAADKKEIFDAIRSMDAEMREVINNLFGTPICSTLFGNMNVYALADGLPAWANLMLAVMEEIRLSFAREQKATNPRIEKYTKKYHR